LHLDCSRTYKFEAKGIIQRQTDGFALDQGHAYPRFLQRKRRSSPRHEAVADHVKVKTRDAAVATDGEEA
jgi:hypothetical protein